MIDVDSVDQDSVGRAPVNQDLVSQDHVDRDQVDRDLNPAEEISICRYPSRCDFRADLETPSLISRYLALAESGWLATLKRCRFRPHYLQVTTPFAILALGVKWCCVVPAVD
jgi:hypothetical protein